jgi:hypothetical protein
MSGKLDSREGLTDTQRDPTSADEDDTGPRDLDTEAPESDAGAAEENIRTTAGKLADVKSVKFTESQVRWGGFVDSRIAGSGAVEQGSGLSHLRPQVRFLSCALLFFYRRVTGNNM